MRHEFNDTRTEKKSRPWRFLLLACLLVGLVWAAESFFKIETARQNLLEHPLLALVPENSLAFIVWKNYKDTPGAVVSSGLPISSLGRLVSEFTSHDETTSKDLTLVTEALDRAGIISLVSTQSESIADGVLFFSPNAESKRINLTVYLIAPADVNYRDKVSALETIMKRENLQVSKENYTGGTGFSIPLSNGNSKAALDLTKLHLAASQNRFAISTSYALSSRFLESKQTSSDSARTISEADQFKPLLAGLTPRGQHLLLGGLDLRALAELWLAANPEKAEEQSPIDKRALIENFLVQRAVFSREFEGNVVDSLTLSLQSKSDDQERWIQAFSQPLAGPSSAVVPPDTTAFFHIHGTTLKHIKDSATAELPADQQDQLKEVLALTDKIKGLSVGIRDEGAAILPSVFVLVEATGAPVVDAGIRAYLSRLLSTNEALPWIEKKINTTKARVLEHKSGLKLFSSRTESNIFLASSEVMLADCLATYSPSGKRLATPIFVQNEKIPEQPKPFLTAYSDSAKLTQLIAGMHGNLADLFAVGNVAKLFAENHGIRLATSEDLAGVFLAASFSANLIQVKMTHLARKEETSGTENPSPKK